MKYLITESQYRKLLLEDSPNPYVGKSLDEFLKKQNTIALNQTKTSSDTGIA